MSAVAAAGAKILSNPHLFSSKVIEMPLRPYQLAAIRPVLHSILTNQGLEFVWMFARQSGKNEALAHLEALLLMYYYRAGGNIVHAAPTGMQLQSDYDRLGERLENKWQHSLTGLLGGKQSGYTIGKAKTLFLSAHPQSQVRGHTAHILLVMNEYQDIMVHIAESDFAPMCSSTNATRLFVGTPKTSNTALAIKIRELRQMEKDDQVQRIYIFDWQTVAKYHPPYEKFVTNEIKKKGPRHPSIITEYWCEELDADGGLFDTRRQALMQGDHSKYESPREDCYYIATLDVAGEDEQDPEDLVNPGRDYTTTWIWELDLDNRFEKGGPTYRAIAGWSDHGSKHFDTGGAGSPISHRLRAFYDHWRISHLIVDSTGVGTGLASFFRGYYGPERVSPFGFTRTSKARLGNRFLQIVETGRFQMYADRDGYTAGGIETGAGFWRQVAACTYEYNPSLPLERGMKWGVGENITFETIDRMGNPITDKVHDDYLLAAALLGHADELIEEEKIVFSIGKSIHIPAPDPIGDMPSIVPPYDPLANM